MPRLFSVLLVLLFAAAPLTAGETLPDLREATREMVAAYKAFWQTLTPEQQAKASFKMDDAERLNWHFIPKKRNGLPLKEMTYTQRLMAHAFLASGMSQRGYMDAVSIMSLEQVLFDLEKAPHRDPEMYFFSVFGTPDENKPWGWRCEGHHMSINFTLVGGVFISGTPTFFGNNPAKVKDGHPRAGSRTLFKEEDLARKLLGALPEDQRKTAIIATEAYKDILTMAQLKFDIGEPKGIPAEKLSAEHKILLADLIKHYATRSRPEVAKQEWDRIERAGFDKVFFAWAGPTEVGGPHYYRVHGPTFLIEYDNVQNGANHIHSVWRDLQNDFGGDILRKHYETNPH